MADFRTQRIRDAVHGLIVFRKGEKLDELAWKLINTAEFQRLRRIKQLGVSEFIFPGATHTRFAHSVGVFHVARQLRDIIKREIGSKRFNAKRAEVAVIAALLHDLGHGPLSHTFEGVTKQASISRRHEAWTAEIILNKAGEIYPLLRAYRKGGSFGEEVADLLRAEDPKDIYHAIVSSSFDADRLDYLRRDRTMTGSGAGAIDFDWLVEHVRVHEVSLAADDIELSGPRHAAAPKAASFCIDIKALPASEAFLLARYTLHEQVYFHKTTRCIEAMIAQLLTRVSVIAKSQSKIQIKTGLPIDHPLIRFFAPRGATVKNYLALDDVVLFGALERMIRATDPMIKQLALRLKNRKLYKTLDVGTFGAEEGTQRAAARRIDKHFKNAIGKTILKDETASLGIYSHIGGDDEKAHKKLRILYADGVDHEISSVSDPIKVLAAKKKPLIRYYFAKDADRSKALEVGRNQ